MDTDIAMQVLNAQSVHLGGDEYAAKNSDRKSFVYKIFTKFAFRHDDERDAKTIQYRFMGLSDAIVKATNGNSDAIYLSTMEGKCIDPQSSPTDPDAFQAYVNWTITVGRQSNAGATIMLHSDVRFSDLLFLILPFLRTNQIFLTPNYSSSSLEEIVRVAAIPFMNPDVTFRKGFSAELNIKLQAVLNVKNAEFKSRYPCINEDFRFDVLVSKEKEKMHFKNASVSCPILMVACPRSQSVLCRILLQEALNLLSPCNDCPSSYSCLPIVLKDAKKYPKGPATFFALLKQHHRFLEEFRYFQIKGVHRTTMTILKSQIMMDCPAINGVEPTFQTDEFGKWNVCSTQAKIKEAQAWVDAHLPNLLDQLATEDKPSVPQACTPHRVIDYAAISDSQVDSLFALSGLSIATPPPISAWGNSPAFATTQAPPTYSTLSESQTSMNEIVSKLKLMESTLQSHDATIKGNHTQSIQSSDQLSAQITDYISDQFLDHASGLHSEFEEYIDDFKDDLQQQSSQISGILSKVAAQEDRFAVLEHTISSQFAPLNEAILGGGLLQSIRACISESQPGTQLALPVPTLLARPVRTQPMDEDFPQTPRRLFDRGVSDDSSISSSRRKRDIRPSPFSRRGQPSPLRARRDHSNSSSPGKSKHL